MNYPSGRPRYAAVIACLLLTAVIGVAPAKAAGYWICANGAWTAIDAPTHPRPLKACGTALQRPKSAAECARAGGRWGPVGLMRRPTCTMPTRDADRVCGDNGECESLCLTSQRGAGPALGKCARATPVFGCMNAVVKGAASGMLCAD